MFRPIVGVISVALVFAGAYLLDARQQIGRGYGLLAIGALLLVLIPESVRSDGQKSGERPLHLGWFAIAFWAATGIAFCLYTARVATFGKTIPGFMHLGTWIGGGLLIVFSFHLWDRRRHPGGLPKLFDTSDWIWMAGLFVAGSAIRVLNLGTEPPGFAGDEFSPIATAMRMIDDPSLPAFATYYGVHGTFLYFTDLFVRFFGPLGLDVVQASKLPVALSGGLSIAALYAAVRILGSRPLAAVAGVFLVAQGWHWILSRYYYRYGSDLAWITLTTAFLIAGLRSGRLSHLAAAGFISAIGLTWISAAMLLAPWSAYVLIDHMIADGRAFRQWIAPLSAWGLTFGLCVLPFVVQLSERSDTLGRIGSLSDNREAELVRRGLDSPQAYYDALRLVPLQLQVREPVRSRETVRPGKPALDLVLSATATVGFFWCLWNFRRQLVARLCLLGLALFLVPALRSYDGGVEPVPRRMVGILPFIAWMAAYGTSIVAGRVAPQTRRFAAMLSLAALSMGLNLYAIRSTYPKNWYAEFGVIRAQIVSAIRDSTEVGPVFFRPTYSTGLPITLPSDKALVSYIRVDSPGDLRSGLMQHAGQMSTVILPWHTTRDRNDTPKWIEEIADVVPPFYWEWGPPDIFGNPVYRIARIRLDPRE